MTLTTPLSRSQGNTASADAVPGPALFALASGANSPSSVDVRARYPTHAYNDALCGGAIERSQFLRVVQREKRRTDRSHSALSLAVLEIDCTAPAARAALLEKLSRMVRETDYTTMIDDGVAVLLPDTGEAGLRRFQDKIALVKHAHVVSVVGATYPDTSFERMLTERLGSSHSRQPLAAKRQQAATHGYKLKRGLDVVGSSIALVLLSPLMLVVAALIKLTSPGPVIFSQQRIGRGGIPFTFYKFRSMRTDSDDRVHREYVASLIDGEPISDGEVAGVAGSFKLKNDPRVTPIGRFIRRTSIDEVPQFWNVLKGDMSLVGPRPPVPYMVDRYKAWHLSRAFEAKPGLTGIWQVEGRSRVSFDDMVRMDLRYLRECSLGLDLIILMRTVRVVLTGEGAR